VDPFARKMVLGSLAFGSTMLLMAGTLAVVYFHARPRCDDQVMAEIESPNRQWVATVFERKCSDPSEWLVHVNLRQASKPIRFGYFSGKAEEGEVFSLELDSRDQIPALAWRSPDHLQIICRNCRDSSIRKREEHWQLVRMLYEISRN
jgi:hypothetical protein